MLPAHALFIPFHGMNLVGFTFQGGSERQNEITALHQHVEASVGLGIVKSQAPSGSSLTLS
jgi:hypothetical protein